MFLREDVFVSCVHPVVMRSAVFSTVCNLLVLVSDIIDDQIVLPYSSVILVMAVYMFSSISLDVLQCVQVRAFSSFVVFFVLSVMFEKVYLGSNVRPNIFMSVLMVSVLSFMVNFRFVECSAAC